LPNKATNFLKLSLENYFWSLLGKFLGIVWKFSVI
jgi:hypothetical protein